MCSKKQEKQNGSPTELLEASVYHTYTHMYHLYTKSSKMFAKHLTMYFWAFLCNVSNTTYDMINHFNLIQLYFTLQWFSSVQYKNTSDQDTNFKQNIHNTIRGTFKRTIT